MINTLTTPCTPFLHKHTHRMPAAINQAAPCATPVVPMPTSGHCNAPVPDCLRNAKLPELGNHTYRHTVGTSETAFNDRYDGSWFAANGGKRGGTRRRRKMRRRSLSRRRTTKRQQRRRTSRRRRRSKRRGGTGYYLDLATCPAGGMPSPVKYDSRSPPVLVGGGGRCQGFAT